MKLATFAIETPNTTVSRTGAVIEGDSGLVMLDLNAGYGQLLSETMGASDAVAESDVIVPPDMIRLLEGGSPTMTAVQETVDNILTRGWQNDAQRLRGPRGERFVYRLAEVRLLPPVPRPTSMRDGYSFEQHVRDGRRRRGFADVAPEWYERPVYYKGNPRSVIGHDEPAWWPSYSEKLDYELEVGVFIGEGGRNIPKESAISHIAGFTIFNDFSARDVQAREMAVNLGPAKSKDFDRGNAIGPWMVTPDEIPDPRALEAVVRINGEIWSQTNTRDMYWSWEDLIAYISRDETLYPGDFIGGGTLAKGCGADIERWIQVGDVIELEVSHLGVLRNRVVKGPVE